MSNTGEPEVTDGYQSSILTFYAQTHTPPKDTSVGDQLPREPCEHCGAPIALLTIKGPGETIRRAFEVIKRSDGTVTFQSHDHDPDGDLIERSSLGTPGAQQLRTRTSPEQAQLVVDRAEESRQVPKDHAP